jgi:CubicO group peptidase (beta-lactamase class C family)
MRTIAPETVGFSSSRLARIVPAMQRYMDQGKLAGTLTMVARRGQVVHFERCGMQDIASGKPMALDTIFRIYSMTKPITSTAVMMLIEEGLLRLSDPVCSYIPQFKEMKVLVRKTDAGPEFEDARQAITVRDLLTHTSGLSYGFDENDDLDQMYRKQIWENVEKQEITILKDLVEAVSTLPLAHQPGTVFHYSLSTDVLGRLVEIISGKALDTFFQERIFGPLKMTDTAFWVSPEKAERFSRLYGPNEKEPGKLVDLEPQETSAFLRPGTWLSGGGGLTSTASDYMRFCQMLLNGGQLDGTRLLGRKTVEMMTQNHLPEGVYEDANHAHGFGLGGYVMVNLAQSQMLGSDGSWGWGGAANTEFWIDFKEQVIGILMLQFMPPGLYPVESDFKNLVYQALVD